jgi:hypothetical protein
MSGTGTPAFTGAPFFAPALRASAACAPVPVQVHSPRGVVFRSAAFQAASGFCLYGCFFRSAAFQGGPRLLPLRVPSPRFRASGSAALRVECCSRVPLSETVDLFS